MYVIYMYLYLYFFFFFFGLGQSEDEGKCLHTEVGKPSGIETGNKENTP